MIRYIGKHIFDYDASFRQNVGIGTDSPSYPLEVVGNIFTKGHIFSVGDNFAIEIDGTDSGGPRMHIGFDHDTDGFITFGAYNNINNLDTKSRDFHLFGNNTTTGFYFDESAGKFGIGTSSPSQKLDVVGNIKLQTTAGSLIIQDTGSTSVKLASSSTLSIEAPSNFRVKTGSSLTENFTVLHSGNVGIGINSPTEKLHVSGNAIITGNLTVSGTTTTIDTTNLNVEDKNITINYSTGDSSSTADGAGITIQDAVDSSNDATILWDATNDEFDFSHGITLTDTNKLKFGDSADLQIHHDGSNSYIKQFDSKTGNLIIEQATDDADIIFKCDDGSGGVTSYFVLDGSVGFNRFYKHARFQDSVEARFGTGNDLKIYHTGTGSVIQNATGNLTIQQDHNDSDIIFRGDDGSGGTTEYFRVDGSSEKTFYSKPILLFDSVALQLGTDTDATLYHSGGEGNLQNFTGNFRIIQGADDSDIQFFCDDGSGGVVEYMRIDGGDERTVFTKHTRHLDNAFFAVGTGGDFTIDHDGSNTSLQNSTGELRIRNYADDQDVVLQTDDGSGGITDYIRLDGSATNVLFSVDTMLNGGGNYIQVDVSDDSLKFADNAKIKLGTGNDLQIYHDSSNSFISHGGTGDLIIQQTTDDKDILFRCDDGTGSFTEYFRLDGGTERIRVSKNLRLSDSVELQLGNVSDLTLAHDGTNSEIANNTGDLTIKNRADDKDIIFQSDDGSGGVATYFYLDGSVGFNRFPYPVIVEDSVNFNLGTGQDMQLLHNGSDSVIRNATGDLYIQQNVDDGDIIFQSDDGSGGTTEYFRLDGGTETNIFSKPVQVGVDDTGHDVIFYGATSDMYLQWDESDNSLKLRDNVKLKIGSGNDLAIHHSGTNSEIKNLNGNLIIQNTSDDSDIIFKTDNGSGGTTTYLTLDGGNTRTLFSQEARFSDNVNLKFGSGGDTMIYHDSSNSYIDHTGTGDLYIRQGTDDGDIIFQSDNGSGGLATYMSIDGGGTDVNFFKDSHHIDNVKAKFGSDSSGDLQIYHDGSNSYIDETGTGVLVIGSSQTNFQVGGANKMIIGTNDITILDNIGLDVGTGGDFQIKHDGSNTLVENITGHLYFYQKADDSDISFFCDDGSGGNAEYFRLDGGAAIIGVSREMRFFDNVKLKLGSGPDAEFYHDGSNTYLLNNTGNLDIRCQTDDGDIIFRCDDGSGGNAEYLRLDGGFSSPQIKIPDDVQMNFGAGLDLRIIHDGFDSYITSNGTGNLYIRQANDDKDIIFQGDDGSGGLTTYFKLDGSSANSGTLYTQFPDNSNLTFGSADDLQIKHDGTDSKITNSTGDLIIRNLADDKDITFQTDDGSGGVTTYFQLDGSSATNIFSKDVLLTDSISLKIGSAADLKLVHDGSNSYIIQQGTGDLYIQNTTDDKDIIFKSDNGSGGTIEYLRLDGSHERLTVNSPNGVVFFDNIKANFGTDSDLQIYHNGTDSVIDNVSGGDLYISQKVADKDLIFRADDGSGGFETYFFLDGSANSDGNPRTKFPDNSRLMFGAGDDLDIFHDGSDSYVRNNSASGDLKIVQGGDDKDIKLICDNGSGGTTEYITLDGSAVTVEVAKPINLASASSSASSGIYAQFINLKGFCTLAANYQFAEDLEDTKSPFEMALDYGSATISSSTEVNQSNLFRAAAFHVPVACSVNAINMQLTCNNAGNVTIAVVEYRPSEAGTDQVDHPRTVYEEVVVASNDNNNKVKTVTVATADLDNTAIPAGSHIMIMAKGDSDSVGGKAFISAAIEIKW